MITMPTIVKSAPRRSTVTAPHPKGSDGGARCGCVGAYGYDMDWILTGRWGCGNGVAVPRDKSFRGVPRGGTHDALRLTRACRTCCSMWRPRIPNSHSSDTSRG